MTSNLIASIRSMLVPIAPSLEDAFHAFVVDYLTGLAIAEEDQPSWITLQLGQWRDLSAPTAEFRQLIRGALYTLNRVPRSFLLAEADGSDEWADYALRASTGYFEMHTALCTVYLLSHDEARQLLAQLGMIIRLAATEGMSASEIARLFAARDQGFAHQWQVIYLILAKLRCAPALSAEAVQRIFEDDADAESDLLGDLDFEGSIARTAEVAIHLGCSPKIEGYLCDLLIRDKHEPYLLILHFQMMILDRYDHAVSYAYEFSPRGQAVAWLNERYLAAGIPVGQNAFLNNAKALLRFDQSWVAGRPDHRRSANALAALLALIESLGLLAKVEIASRIRGLLHRYIRVSQDLNGPIPNRIDGITNDDLERLFDRAGQRNSATGGILEQRIVDCLGVLRHPVSEGWSARGVGDSVHAPNLPRKKCGDCEFELARPDNPVIVAYEAHGGQLSAPYVADHLNSLSKILRARAEDLSAIRALEDWTITIIFVSHSVIGQLPPHATIETGFGDANVVFEYLPFSEASAEVFAKAGPEVSQSTLIDPLNSPFVHPKVRVRTLELLEPEA